MAIAVMMAGQLRIVLWLTIASDRIAAVRRSPTPSGSANSNWRCWIAVRRRGLTGFESPLDHRPRRA